MRTYLDKEELKTEINKKFEKYIAEFDKQENESKLERNMKMKSEKRMM